MQETGPKS